MPRIKDISGQTFSRLTVVAFAGQDAGHLALWECRCECGTVKVLRGSDLRGGQVKSCGCLFASDEFRERFTTHDMTHSPEYTSWRSMIERCENPEASNYDLYGGRGISVCERWRQSFEAFFEDMGPRPDGHTLDRKEGDGNYEPGNCRWATRTQQQRNRRNTIWLSINGERKPLAEWAEIGGLPIETLRHRVNYLKWSAEKAVFQPLQKHVRRRGTPAEVA